MKTFHKAVMSQTIYMMNNMAALTDISKEELYSFIDLSINDRAGDNIVMLDELKLKNGNFVMRMFH